MDISIPAGASHDRLARFLQLLPARACPRCGFPLDDEHVYMLCARRPAILIALGHSLGDQEEYLPAPADFRSDLLTQARLALGRADHLLAQFIINALDDNGLLSGHTSAARHPIARPARHYRAPCKSRLMS